MSKKLIKHAEICLDITKQNFSIILKVFQSFFSILVKISSF
jgi:hypothetical protein